MQRYLLADMKGVLSQHFDYLVILLFILFTHQLFSGSFSLLPLHLFSPPLSLFLVMTIPHGISVSFSVVVVAAVLPDCTWDNLAFYAKWHSTGAGVLRLSFSEPDSVAANLFPSLFPFHVC